TSPALRVQTNGYINSTDGNSDTQYFLNDIYFGTTYHWRVRAINAVDTSAWSPIWTFVTRNFVTQSSPAIGSDVWAGVTLNWAPHTGVQFYQVQADTSTLFNSSALRVQTNGYINSTDGNSDTQYFLTDIYFGTSYHWRVRAINAVDTTSWSPVWIFVTRDYVTLTSPANEATNVSLNPTLNWTPHTGVGSYTLQVDVSNLFNTGALQTFQKAYINSTDGNSDTQQGISGLAANTVYFWRVRANNAVDSSAWTTRWFSTGTATPVFPGIPTLASGQCGITQVSTQAHTLNWDAVAEADFYQLELRLFGQLDGTPTVSTISGTSYTAANLLEGITYQWRVRAVDAGLVGDWSTACTFTTQAAVSISAPVLDEQQYCAGDVLSFNSFTSENFGANNVFSVFLSNANGDFSFPPPTLLGTFTSEGASFETFSIPENLIGGSNYKILVSASEPQFTGAPSSSFSINALPELEGDLSLLVCAQSGLVDLPVIQPEGGIYNGVGVSGNAFNPALAGPGLIDLSYTYTNSAGCSSTLLGTAQVETCTSVEVPSAILNGSQLITKGNFSVDVFDMQGKLVGRSQCNNTVIDLNTLVLRDGIYLILISDGRTSIGKKAALIK
ncbi:MAG: T9SS type A sorting domain-containing protein, partial [Bacteroidia bacterium]